jgi:hypothetical protein
MAQSGHPNSVSRCLLSGVKRTFAVLAMTAQGSQSPTRPPSTCDATSRAAPYAPPHQPDYRKNAQQHFSEHASDDLHLGREARDFDKNM